MAIQAHPTSGRFARTSVNAHVPKSLSTVSQRRSGPRPRATQVVSRVTSPQVNHGTIVHWHANHPKTHHARRFVYCLCPPTHHSVLVMEQRAPAFLREKICKSTIHVCISSEKKTHDFRAQYCQLVNRAFLRIQDLSVGQPRVFANPGPVRCLSQRTSDHRIGYQRR